MWTFQQVNGWLDLNGVLRSRLCYSGNGEGFNNPAMQGVHLVGPIVCGNYKIGKPIDTHPKLGKFVMALMPDDATRARILELGRNPDSFFLHGKPLPPADINSGSDGCICAEKETRIQVAESGDNDLEVISGLVAAPDLTGEISV